nr:PREDICTED: cell surface A33 antigen [Latimeria chalumnae]|eukprot:XP_006008256.1 PREDICTED: cell surface A33 antigen [Latimeria chalumnae]
MYTWLQSKKDNWFPSAVAPSVPICKIEGKVEYGEDIKLTCHSEEGSPKPEYKWISYSTQKTMRPLPQKSKQENGNLHLTNISLETSGYFTCESSNRIHTASCNLTLTVMPPSMNTAAIAGAIGGIAGAILLLGIIIYCCCCRNKKEPAEYEMKDHEDEEDARVQSKPYHDDDPDDREDNFRDAAPTPPPNKPRSIPDNNHYDV